MKKYFLRNLAIAASLSVAAVSCTPSTPAPNNTPAAATSSPTTAASPTASPTVASTPSPSPTATATATATAKPNATESPSAEKPADTVRIAVVNNSGKVLKSIYMSAPKKEDWGDNELDVPLKDREKADFEWKRSDYKGDDAGCIFDIRAEYDDGKFAELDPIDVCKTPAINLK
ncbi:MAG: hypothetical protein M1G31_22990 [Pseudanabaena sp. Salubria-1]|jgi:hypothetical protein|nr:hypothetical protein [Pseudanabaena sp. Salubria-1]